MVHSEASHLGEGVAGFCKTTVLLHYPTFSMPVRNCDIISDIKTFLTLIEKINMSFQVCFLLPTLHVEQLPRPLFASGFGAGYCKRSYI